MNPSNQGGMRRIGVGKRGMRMEILEIWCGNEGDQGENLLIGAEAMNKKCGEIKIKINVNLYEIMVLASWYGNN